MVHMYIQGFDMTSEDTLQASYDNALWSLLGNLIRSCLKVLIWLTGSSTVILHMVSWNRVTCHLSTLLIISAKFNSIFLIYIHLSHLFLSNSGLAILYRTLAGLILYILSAYVHAPYVPKQQQQAGTDNSSIANKFTHSFWTIFNNHLWTLLSKVRYVL